jgi:hypothetical protein
LRGIRRHLNWIEGIRSIGLDKPQASVAQRLQLVATRNKDYVLARAREPPADITANRTGAHNCDSH